MSKLGKSIGKVLTVVVNLLFPPKCVSCGEFIQKDMLDLCEIPFCEKCRSKWELEKLDECPDCGLEMTLCNCRAPMLDKSGVEDYIKLVNYSSGARSVGKNAVLYLKRHKNNRALNYFATQLSYPAKARIDRMVSNKAVVAYVPRSGKSKRLLGFDQSKEIAVRLAKKLGIPCVKLFVRKSTSRVEQKKLNLAQRKDNAQNLYGVNLGALEMLKEIDSVFLVDDVMTSGASLYGCVSALKRHFSGRIVAVTLARTGKKSKK